MTGEAHAAGAFYGRRKGKRLRAGQEDLIGTLLPRLRLPAAPGKDGRPRPVIDDLASLFPGSPGQVVLEIGFGGGEHLLAEARQAPATGFIGCEPFINGVAKCLAIVEAEGLANIRLWDADASDLLAALPPACLDIVYLLYPDPWPKRRQRKRRFVSDERLRAIARALKPGGEFRFATDIDDYAGWTLARLLRSPDFAWEAEGPDAWRNPWAGWESTRYEAKARREGRGSTYITARRNADPD